MLAPGPLERQLKILSAILPFCRELDLCGGIQQG